MQLKYKIGLVILLLTIFTIGVVAGTKKKDKDLDLLVGVVTDDGLYMMSVSPSRRMINSVKVDGEREVWIPEGMGWYRSDRIKRILKNEKKEALIEKIFWYNYGFEPKKIIWREKGEDELTGVEIFQSGGWWWWFKYQTENTNWLLKKEVLTVFDEEEKIDEIMARDMAETGVVNLKSRVIVANLSSFPGLANFVARNLERSGLVVVDTTNFSNEKVEKCLILVGIDDEVSDWMSKRFSECEIKTDTKINAGEQEIYFGEDWAKMINYESYSSKY